MKIIGQLNARTKDRAHLLVANVALAAILCGAMLAAPQSGFGQSLLKTTTPTDKHAPYIVADEKQLASGPSSTYYWVSDSVGDSAQLLTLLCHACNSFDSIEPDVPLVSVLRDTLGDQTNENDRITYVWLLSSTPSRLHQRILSAIPFFYWRVGSGSQSVTNHNLKPLIDVSAPEPSLIAQGVRNLLQLIFDPMVTPVRPSTQEYRSNVLENERLHLEEVISYLRQAPTSNDSGALTQAQLDIVIARLELRKTPLGGLVSENQARRVGIESNFEQERIRSRNAELLRQWAEKSGLMFEPLELAGHQGRYGILWFPQSRSTLQKGTAQHSMWKLLGIRDPWSDSRLRNWTGPVYERSFDENEPEKAIPLAVYNFDYPKLPLVTVDFRKKLTARRREVIQRSTKELTGGVIGLSYLTNWYFYLGFDLHRFVVGRRGKPVDEASRLDCYSDFRMDLALDRNIDPTLKKEMEDRIQPLSVNPLESAPQVEIQNAISRYKLLKEEAKDGRLIERVDQERRFELSSFGQSEKGKLAKDMLHVFTLGLYKQQTPNDDLFLLDCDRRVTYQLNFLNALVQAETPPEIAYDTEHIKSSVHELSSLMPAISSSAVRSQAEATLERLKNLSNDAELQADCTSALALMKQTDELRRAAAIAAFSGDMPDEFSSPDPERAK